MIARAVERREEFCRFKKIVSDCRGINRVRYAFALAAGLDKGGCKEVFEGVAMNLCR